MKKLPIGIQTFEELINENYLYIDKTEYLYQLLLGKYYFFSRPRRFGKSMTISTLEQIFLGNQELFKGLWIYDKIIWEKYTIIRLDFSSIYDKDKKLSDSIVNRLETIANEYGLNLEKDTVKEKFQELILKLSVNKKVVILIDEYDKPIVDHIENNENANLNREILQNLYSVIKGNDNNIKFLLLTGVSKFAKVSLFSEFNNLHDITTTKTFSAMCGITEDEMQLYFEPYIDKLKLDYSDTYSDIKKEIKSWYNGYSWDGVISVYNPFSILNLFSNMQFDNYWYYSGTPKFLLSYIKKYQFTSLDIEKQVIDLSHFNKHEIDNMSLLSLMFQTGYLTIKAYYRHNNTVLLDYPNKEVENSFTTHLLSEFNNGQTDKTAMLVRDLDNALSNNNLDKFIELLKVTFKNVTYPNIEDSEKYYHSIFYLVLKLLGFNIESEVMTIDGRIDAVIHTETTIYVIEFKIGDAQKALAQIKEKNYHQKYLHENKSIVMLGIGFNLRKKNIGSVEIEKVKEI